MDDEIKFDILDADDGLDERIRNTANIIAEFAKENLDEDKADEILSILSGIKNKDDAE